MDQETSALRAEIARERREIGETVAALVEKTDVKGQTQRKLSETREAIDRRKGRAIAIAAAVGGVVVLMGLLRRR